MNALTPKGFRTVTAYPVVSDAAAFIEFLKTVFSAEETFRAVGGAGGLHAEMRLGDSMLMLGGGGPELKWSGASRPMAFHIGVPDTDAAYNGAVSLGSTTLSPPADQFWGERSANIRDPFGNRSYIGAHTGESFVFPGIVLQPYLHPVQAEPVIEFISRAFDAEELGRFTTEDGRIEHTTIRIGDATLEMSEAQGPYQSMPSMFYMYVADVDAAYNRAVQTGGTSISLPADQSYGDRTAAVNDGFGNSWYLATHKAKS